MLEEFKKTLTQSEAPQELSPALKALWEVANDHWKQSHDIVNDINTPTGYWIHAHLHRVEGDLSNAAYWYHKADRPICDSSLEEEWCNLAAFLLDGNE